MLTLGTSVISPVPLTVGPPHTHTPSSVGPPLSLERAVKFSTGERLLRWEDHLRPVDRAVGTTPPFVPLARPLRTATGFVHNTEGTK